MISLSLARRLKKAGLEWKPAMLDFFAIPDRDLDNKVYVISDVMSNLEFRFGRQVVAFQGASEWALDYLVTTEAIWIPTEEQLRQALNERLTAEDNQISTLTCRPGKCECKIRYLGQEMAFESVQACDAYGEALLFVLQVDGEENPPIDRG